MARKVVPAGAGRATFEVWIALALLGIAGLAAFESTVAVNKAVAWIKHSRDVMADIAAERAELTEAETCRALLLAGVGDWLAPYAAAMKGVHTHGAMVRGLTVDNASQQRRLDAIEPLIESGASAFASLLAARDAGTIDVDATRTGRVLDARLDGMLSEMTNEELRLLVIRQSDESWTVGAMRITALGGTILSFAMLLVAFRRLRLETTKRIGSEAAAAEGEENLEKVLMSIGDGVIVADAKGRVTRMNPVAELLTGWSAIAALGKPASQVFRIIDADTRAKLADPIARALDEKVTFLHDNPCLLIQRDGREIPVKDSCARVRGAEGGVQGAVLVFRDVSEAQRAKTFFRALVEKSTDGISLTDSEGNFLYASPAASRILGRGDDAVIGTNVLDYAYPDDVARLREFNRALAEKPGVVADTERRVRAADGACRWVEVIATNMVDDPAVGAIVRNMRDITERKSAELALSASETQFARLSESGMIGIARADLGGAVHDSNDTYLRMLGYTRADLNAGKVRWATATPTEPTDEDAGGKEQMMFTGVATPREKELVRQDGSHVPVLVGAAIQCAYWRS